MHLRSRAWAGRLAAVLALAAALAGCSPGPVKFVAEGKPDKLGEWQLLRVADGRLSLAEGVEPYELNTPLFTDYAHKLRTIWMPKGASARYDANEAFDFPVGTIISKTFYYPRGEGAALRQAAALPASEGLPTSLDLQRVRLIETRLLVRREAGWVALPYVWNAEQTEATLMRTGEQMPLELQADDGRRQRLTYVVPNENQCASCHVTQLKTKAFQPIGPKARHLNLQARYGEQRENQLEHLQRIGYLGGLPAGAAADLPRAANWQDAGQPLEARARAYLDINCAHCHSPKGSASNTALNLEPFLPTSHRLGLCKPSVAAGKGTGDRLFGIVPGQPDASIMPFRLASTEGGVMMPELGRSIVHAEGLALIRDWIAAMPGHCDSVSAVQAGLPAPPAASTLAAAASPH